jgi:hypothetical protein
VDAPAEVATRALAGKREHVDVVVPRIGVKARMRLVSRSEVAQLTADARRFFAELGLPNDPVGLAAVGLLAEWHNEIACRHLAIAVRVSDDGPPLATVGEWRDDCDDDQIAALWQEYQDRAEQLDPLRDGTQLDSSEILKIAAALKKKDATGLRSFGSRKLASYMISTADPPAT